MTEQLPDELWLGMVGGQWPIWAFTAEGHAILWVEMRPIDSETRRVWKVRLADAIEYRLVQTPNRFEAVQP